MLFVHSLLCDDGQWDFLAFSIIKWSVMMMIIHVSCVQVQDFL